MKNKQPNYAYFYSPLIIVINLIFSNGMHLINMIDGIQLDRDTYIEV